MSRWHEIWAARRQIGEGTALADLIRADGFDTGAGKVDEAAWSKYVEELVTRLGAIVGDSMFEVGCGAGALLLVFHKAGYPVAGIDYSPTLIQYAQQAMPGMPFAVGEANTLSGSVHDYVLANSVFSYFPDMEYAHEVVARMLAMAGKGAAILDVPDAARQAAAEAARRGALPPGDYEARYRGLQHRYYAREWFSWIAARHGWQVDIADQWLAGYGNAPHRFNVIFKRGAA